MPYTSNQFHHVFVRVPFSAQLLGFDDYIPAYAGASNDQLLTGVNFASAAAGIRDETGQQLVRACCIINHVFIFILARSSFESAGQVNMLIDAHDVGE